MDHDQPSYSYAFFDRCAGQHTPVRGHLQPEQRQAFLDELRTTLQDLLTRYGGADGDAFRLAVACYPKGEARE